MNKETNKILAVIDTNVIVSAFFSKDGKSNPSLIVRHILERLIIPLYNDEILDEYFEVLSRPQFHFKKEQIYSFIQTIRDNGYNTQRTKVIGEIFPDPDDIVFYEVKMSVEDSYLVTGNLKHFPQKPFVVTPTQMIEIIKDLKADK